MVESMRALLASLAVTAVALAGCTAEPPPEPLPTPAPPPGPAPPTEPAEPEPDGTVEVSLFNGTAAGVTAPSVGALGAPGSEPGTTFEVKAGATAIVVEVAWETGDKLYLFVDPPCRDEDPTGATTDCPTPDRDMDGQSPARVETVDPAFLNMTGAWSFAAFPEANVQGAAFTAAVSVFYGMVPEATYSALLAGQGP